jgi:hypothetical protein
MPEMLVLQADYDIRCFESPEWWALAIVSGLGLVFVSFGVPIGM